METSIKLLDCILKEAGELERIVKSHSFDYSPVLLRRPPSYRESRRGELAQSLESLDSQWSRMEQIMIRFEDVRNVLRQRRSLCRSALSPVSALPQEILAQVFQFALHMDAITEYERTTERIRHLSQVCRDWRVVGLQQNRAWAFGNITGLSEVSDLHQLLERSRDENFTLTVADRHQKTDLSRNIAAKLRDRLSDLEWRCGAPLERFFDFLQMPPLLPSSSILLPSLRSLRVRSQNRYVGDEVSMAGIEFPLLSSLTLEGISISSLRVGSLSSLRSVSLSEVVIDRYAMLLYLEHSPALKELTIDDCSTSDTFFGLSEQVNVPLLESLSLNPRQHDMIIDIFASYKFPALQRLYLDVEDCVHEHPSQSYPNPNYPNNPWFEPLRVNTHLYDALCSMPKLSDVSLHLPLSSLRAALRALTPSTSEDNKTLHKLVTVAITISFPECEEMETGQCIGKNHGEQRAKEVGNLIASMLEARDCIKNPLESLYLDICQVNERLEKLVKRPIIFDYCQTCERDGADMW